MGAIDGALREAAAAVVGALVTTPTRFSRTPAADYATGTAGAPTLWDVIAGPPESMAEVIIARGGLPDSSLGGELRLTVPALNVPASMVEPRTGDRVLLPGETAERVVVGVERVGAEEPAAWVVRVRP